MKTWHDTASPWGKRLHFEDAEFEFMMDELRERAGCEVFARGKGVDVDLVLLRGFDIEADYLNLPDGVMGRTRFYPDGRAFVEVSRALAEEAERDAVARWRLRSTLAHECGHVGCHRSLFVRDVETLPLFDMESREKPGIVCRNETVDEPRYRGEWWEFQANRCMGALLMPGELIQAELAGALSETGFKNFSEALRAGVSEAVVRALAKAFDVSFAVVFYRLEQLGYLPKAGQAALRL